MKTNTIPATIGKLPVDGIRKSQVDGIRRHAYFHFYKLLFNSHTSSSFRQLSECAGEMNQRCAELRSSLRVRFFSRDAQSTVVGCTFVSSLSLSRLELTQHSSLEREENKILPLLSRGGTRKENTLFITKLNILFITILLGLVE